MKNIIALVIFILTCIAFELAACTGVLMKSTTGAAVSGRTVEFAQLLELKVAVVPRNYTYTGMTNNGEGMKFTTKYGAAGIYAFDEKTLMDGINEKGLVAAAFYFPGFASYATITEENQSKALSPNQFPSWILGQFATVDEVKAALSSVVIAPTIVKGWGQEPPPMHYIVYDKNGKSIVIEPLDGTLKVYENKIGVLTNAPTFDWHMENLRNYVNLSPYDIEKAEIQDITITPFGLGSGMLGLPGDFTPPSRFIQAALFTSTGIPVKSQDDLVNQTFHVLNQFDVPLGVSRQSRTDKLKDDFTLFTTVKDSERSRFYFRSYTDQTIKFVDLTKFDLDAKEIKMVVGKGEITFTDVSSELR